MTEQRAVHLRISANWMRYGIGEEYPGEWPRGERDHEVYRLMVPGFSVTVQDLGGGVWLWELGHENPEDLPYDKCVGKAVSLGAAQRDAVDGMRRSMRRYEEMTLEEESEHVV